MSDYYTENPESFRGHQLTFSHLSVLRNKRDILKDVSGAANPGEILAVMGPSGSGKTTLLSLLAGRLSPGRGEVTLNGRLLDKQLRRRISFVLQEDAYLCNLTCWDTLWYTALLRLPGSIPTHKKKEIVSDVVDMLDMRQCLNTKIGNEYIRGISGGEKRKLSIACELLTNPVLMLLDEPTSGLDSSAAHSFCSKIQKVAKSANKTVVMSIHQPSSQLFNMFDKLLLLCDGQVAYYGEAKKCAQHFAALGLPCPTNYNIADHILDQVKSSEDVKRKILRHAANQLKAEITEAGELKNGTADLTEDEGDGYQKLIATPQEESKKATCSRTSVPSESSWSVLNETTPKKLTRSNRVRVYVKEQLAKLEDVKTGLVDQVRTCGADMLPEVEGQICKHTNEFKEKWPTSFAAQHSVLFRRCLKQTWPRVLSKWNVLQMIIIGIFAGILWFQTKAVESEIGNRKGLIFFCIICTSFCCLLDSTISVFSDRAVLNKERVSGYYRLSAYYIAKNVSGIVSGVLD
ncbi:hypothetical protein EB796_019552 [Bugula neritina]|uniref:ABC transporter domain-containing protein n=1 Tax=Bugula neritina TaxID=10212 RepID=A0A7J7J7K1_BUGNE|nr:hypothetical protein EB796_019552 [Bugula neritina]